MVVDVTLIHEYHGESFADVSRNGHLCHPTPTFPALLYIKATTMVRKYKTTIWTLIVLSHKAFLPACPPVGESRWTGVPIPADICAKKLL